MRQYASRYAVILVVASFLLACSKDENREDASKATVNSATGFEVQPVEVIDPSGVKELVAQRNGKILFLNLWATWCQPCVEEFPEIVKLANEYTGSEIEFVAISFDYPDEVESKILPFLRDKKVPFKVLVADSDDAEAMINAINPNWNGALPATLVYDVSGKRQSFLVGQRSYEDLKKEISKTRQPS